jgi:hypothetical protein
MRKAIALLALQAGVILGWAGHHESVRAHAPTFRVPLAPHDPYDVLRGRYFGLNPADGRIEVGGSSSRLTPSAVAAFLEGERWFQGDALVGFCPQGDVHRVCALHRLGPVPADVAAYWSRARVNAAAYEDKASVTIDLGLRRFFIPNRAVMPDERTGVWQLEVSHRPNARLLPRRLWHDGAPLDLR